MIARLCLIAAVCVVTVPAAAVAAPPLMCVAFSPYVGGFNPNGGPHPSADDIAVLLDQLIERTSAACIMTYGVLNGLDETFPLARERGLKVVAILWLDADRDINEQSIALGIAAARTYADTIVRLSCGSEVRTRHGNTLDGEILDCITRLRAAGVAQPITTIDTWWEWCNRAQPCQTSAFAPHVDWIGINVFPWWENRFSGIFPCTSAADASAFHVARLEDVMVRYPALAVVLTEFGWPGGPEGYSEVNQFTGQRCGVAGETNQRLVVRETVSQLRTRGWPGVIFEAFREPWKVAEGPVGPWWGLCNPSASCVLEPLFFTDDPIVAGTTPLRAVHVLEMRNRVNALRARRGLEPRVWTDDGLDGATLVKAVHLNEVRSALEEVYLRDGRIPPGYTANPVVVGAPATAADVNETRNAIQRVE